MISGWRLSAIFRTNALFLKRTRSTGKTIDFISMPILNFALSVMFMWTLVSKEIRRYASMPTITTPFQF